SLPMYPLDLPPFPTRRSSDLFDPPAAAKVYDVTLCLHYYLIVLILVTSRHSQCKTQANFTSYPIPPRFPIVRFTRSHSTTAWTRSEEHTSELQSRENLVCRLL